MFRRNYDYANPFVSESAYQIRILGRGHRLKGTAIHIFAADAVPLNDHFCDLTFLHLVNKIAENDLGLGNQGFIEYVKQGDQN